MTVTKKLSDARHKIFRLDRAKIVRDISNPFRDLSPMTPSEFRRIRRGTLDMTQGQLADALGLSARTIVNIETAREPVDTYYALAIKYLAEQSRVTAE